jgi:hypothetical protein
MSGQKRQFVERRTNILALLSFDNLTVGCVKLIDLVDECMAPARLRAC